MYTKETVAGLCDHTLLKPAATRSDVLKLCDEAKRYRFASVCVNGQYVRDVAQALKGSGVKTAAVVGFPLGAMSSPAKVAETAQAVADGADEIDMVISIGALKGGDHQLVEEDVRGVVAAAKGAPVKAIIETCLLTDAEKVTACTLAVKAGAKFVKTSTGFSTGGATVEDVRLMRETVGDGIGVKASGGIRTRADAIAMIEAGANRLGTGSAMAIMAEFE